MVFSRVESLLFVDKHNQPTVYSSALFINQWLDTRTIKEPFHMTELCGEKIIQNHLWVYGAMSDENCVIEAAAREIIMW